MADLTDTQLRTAAASRPGYATYPQYRPGQPERLAQLGWPVVDRDALVDALRAAASTAPAAPVAAPVIATAEPIAAPLAELPPAPLAELPASPVFEFVPRRMTDLPWWRPRWSWAVMPATAETQWGYCWTLSGARRRTGRAARRAARAMSVGGSR